MLIVRLVCDSGAVKNPSVIKSALRALSLKVGEEVRAATAKDKKVDARFKVVKVENLRVLRKEIVNC